MPSYVILVVHQDVIQAEFAFLGYVNVSWLAKPVDTISGAETGRNMCESTTSRLITEATSSSCLGTITLGTGSAQLARWISVSRRPRL